MKNRVVQVKFKEEHNMVRTEYAKWWDLQYPAQDRLDEIRQRLESGSPSEVTLVNLGGGDGAGEIVDALQDICGEHFIGADEPRQMLLLRSQAWTLARAENYERLSALVAVLQEALQVAHRANPAESVRLAHKSQRLLAKFPELRVRFQRLESGLASSPRETRSEAGR
jgi:hypothetical protein